MNRRSQAHLHWLEDAVDGEIHSSRRDALIKVFEEIEDQATGDEVSEFGDAVREYVDRTGRLPEAKLLRRRALKICRDNGHDIAYGYLVR